MEKQNTIKKNTKTNKKSRFWFGFRIYAAVLVLLVVISCFAVWNTMKKYEAAQPERMVENVISKLVKGDFSGINCQIQGNKYENDIDITGELSDMLMGKELTYKQAEGSYDSLAPVFDIFDGEVKVAKVSLHSVKEYRKMAILVLSEWEITSVEPYIGAGNYQIDITLPSNFKVEVNGVPLSEDEIISKEETDAFRYPEEYVVIPKIVTYEIKGLKNLPVLTVNDIVIAQEDITWDNNKLAYETGYLTKEISNEMSEYVLNAAKTYSNFFSKDVEGCSVSVAPIAGLFPENSYYLVMAEQYRQQDMWMYSAHEAPVFSNEQVIDYTEYGDECFSVKVIFDKSMKLTLNGEVKVDHNNQIYYYVKTGDKWLIADIRENV